MNHGNYDDDDEDDFAHPPNYGYGAGAGRGVGRGMPGGSLLSQMMNGGGGMGGMGGMGFGGFGGYGYAAERAGRPSAFDEYFKAFSVATMEVVERPNLAYGGKVIMPPSVLAKLTNLNVESPWIFNLRNPRDPSKLSTHCGVMEFIADEGLVYLPGWMMRQLELQEGDPIRFTGASLPKGKLVKIQAQHLDFLEVSSPKDVLESALVNFTALTKGDTIEIYYNMIKFEFLIVETTPAGPGICVIDTDLEVDFDRPKGYVSPKAVVKPLPTMAKKHGIDINEQVNSNVPTRPGSVASSRGGYAGSGIAGSLGEGSAFEMFKGQGNALNGRKSKGKGKKKEIEEVDADSKIIRTDKPRFVTNEILANSDRPVPAPLRLPFGKIFVGYKYIPFDETKEIKKPKPEDGAAKPSSAFIGQGSNLSGRQPAANSSQTQPTASSSKQAEPKTDDHWAKLAGGSQLNARSTGNTLNSGNQSRLGSGMATPSGTGSNAAEPIEVDEDDDDYDYGAAGEVDDDYDYGQEDDDDDVIMIDDSD